MSAPMRELLVKTASAGLLGAGVLGALRLATRPPKLPETIATHGAFCSRYPALAHALARFTTIEEAAALERACKSVARIAELERDMHPASMWKIARLAAGVEGELKSAISRALLRADTYADAMVCETDALPTVKSGLDAIIHNHLIDYESVCNIR